MHSDSGITRIRSSSNSGRSSLPPALNIDEILQLKDATADSFNENGAQLPEINKEGKESGDSLGKSETAQLYRNTEFMRTSSIENMRSSFEGYDTDESSRKGGDLHIRDMVTISILFLFSGVVYFIAFLSG